MPCFSILADECQLSIIAIEQATPLLLNGIYYQFIHVTQSPQAKSTLINNHFSTSTSVVQGINFHQISRLHPQIAPFHQAFFSNEKAFWLLVGVVSARTGISPSRLQPLTDWLAFLALQSTAQCLKFTHTNVTAFIQWLPHSLPDAKLVDITMLESILVDSDTRPRLFFKTSPCLSAHQNESELEKDFFAEHKAILQSYLQSQPFGMVPLTVANNDQNPTTALPKLSPPIFSPKQRLSSAKDIFTQKTPTKTPWHTVLQKHWMPFAAGLTALVIGGIGAFATANKTNPTPNVETKPLAEIPHDVAIVRTDTNVNKTSATSDSKSKSQKPSPDKKHSTHKDTKKLPTQKIKSDKSKKAEDNKRTTSHEKTVTSQVNKASTNKKPKSTATTTKKSIKKPVKSNDEAD